ncbi:MAG: Ig-like domain-containing protein [Saprospiraceae bacterium]|nr:Ig-like domain-containing protein [Saprospiraceae bacterium]
MKILSHIQTILVVIFSLLAMPLAFSQLADPILVNLKSTGSSYSDQFAADTDYAYGEVQPESSQLGNAGISIGASNTLKVMFTPVPGAVGTTDYIVTYFTLSSPIHPVTKWYRFTVSNEIVVTNGDQYVIDLGGINVPLAVLQNDSATAGSFFLASVSVINSGSASINATGDSILFTPDVDFTGDTWIQYIACDSAGNCSQGTAHVLVRDPNLQDQLTFQKYLLNQEQLEVLTPFEGFTVEVTPTNGELDAIGPATWVYTPNEGFTGNDTFRVGLAGQVTRAYYITVYEKAINIQARDDKFYVRPALSVSFNVLNNDLLDYDLTSYTNPSKGTLLESGNGSFTYSPFPGYRGVDKFTYTSCFEDTVYCETATVFIHVTDLEPENVFTYQFQTTKNLPLTIDYPIAYTDFSYIITQEPQHGELVNYAGLNTIELPCEAIEAFNMLVYEPEAGYIGADHFEYYYCIQPSNLCYLVKVDMNVIEAPEVESCACIRDCVWPGDADLDGRVDMSDLLTMGYRLGETGPVRSYNNPEIWFGQHADNWNYSGNNLGTQYLDANGDGTITAADVDIINEHYYRAHDVVVKDVQQKLPYQFSLIPVQFSLDSGDVVILDVAFGNANVPVLDMKGAKFSVNIPPAMMDSSSVTVTFHQNSWLAEGSPAISLGKVPWTGRIDAGYAKAEGNGASGFGVIGTITFIITDDFEGFKEDDGIIQIPISLHAATAMGADGTLYDVEGDEVILTYDRGNSSKDNYKLIVYPNPAQDFVNIHLNGKTAIESVSLVDPQGRIIRNYDDIHQKHHQIDIGALPAGLYYMQVNHTHGVMTQLLSVIR